ncbi:copper resistance protein CopC [Micromonospora sp. CPCC 205539]|uniref:copper resistance CopC family protein n=1 Tax=Micromonospora sp. CPCC 205539 TaxID=3122408 RepID=UPI002FEFEA47
MRSRPVTARNVLSRTVAALAATLAVSLLLPAAPASAHGQLATSTPLTGTVVREPLERVGLYFTEKPASNAHFTVTGPSGSRVDNGWSYGEPKRLDKPVQEYFMVNGVFEPRLYHTGFPAMVAVAHWPAKGRYTASYLSVASDGEAVRGSVTFDYQGRTTAAPAGWTAPTDGPAATLLALVEGHSSASPGAAGASPVPGAVTGAPATEPAGASQTRKEGGLPPWLVPALVIVVVAAIVLVAARRRPVSRAAGTPARRSGTPARAPRTPAQRSGNRPGTRAGGPTKRGRR